MSDVDIPRENEVPSTTTVTSSLDAGLLTNTVTPLVSRDSSVVVSATDITFSPVKLTTPAISAERTITTSGQRQDTNAPIHAAGNSPNIDGSGLQNTRTSEVTPGQHPVAYRSDNLSGAEPIKALSNYNNVPEQRLGDSYTPRVERPAGYDVNSTDLTANRITVGRSNEITPLPNLFVVERNHPEPISRPTIQARIEINESRIPQIITADRPVELLDRPHQVVQRIEQLPEHRPEQRIEPPAAHLAQVHDAVIHPASHAIFANPAEDGRLFVARMPDTVQQLSERLHSIIESAVGFITTNQVRESLLSNTLSGIRRPLDLGVGNHIISLATIFNQRQVIPAIFNILLPGQEVGTEGNAVIGQTNVTGQALQGREFSKYINSAILTILNSALGTPGTPGAPGFNGLGAELGLRGDLSARSLLNPNLSNALLTGHRAEAGSPTYTIKGEAARIINANLIGNAQITGSITGMGRRGKKDNVWITAEAVNDSTTDNTTCGRNVRLITGLELGLIIALAGIAKYEDRSNRKVANMTGMESGNQLLDASQSCKVIAKTIEAKKVQKRLPSYNWNNQWKSPEKIKVKGLLKKLKEDRKDLKDQDMRKLESSTSAEELLSRLSKIVTRDEKRLDARKLLSNFATTVEEKLAQQKNPAAQTQTTSSYRPLWLVTKKDSLSLLAEQIYQDPDVGWLIADMNIRRVRETWMNGKRIIELQSRQQLELPIQEDIDLFKAHKAKEACGENLITIVVENQLDKELVNSQLQALQIKRKAIETT